MILVTKEGTKCLRGWTSGRKSKSKGSKGQKGQASDGKDTPLNGQLSSSQENKMDVDDSDQETDATDHEESEGEDTEEEDGADSDRKGV